MRWLIGFLLVVAVVTLPREGSAQADGDDSLSSWQVEDEGALTATPEPGGREANRVRNAGIGLGVSGLAFSAGLVLGGIGGFSSDCYSFGSPRKEWCDPMLMAGVVLTVGGFAGMLTSGILYAKRKRQRDREGQSFRGAPRRAQWDPARSRLVF